MARGLFTEEFVRNTNYHLQKILREREGYINNFYYCPHHPTEGEEPYRRICDCRKPAPGMLVQAAKKAGVKGILVKTGYGSELLQDDGPDKAKPENKPDFIAADILDAVKWILKDRK